MTSPRTRGPKLIETVTPRTNVGIFSSHALGVVDSEEVSSDKSEDSVYECTDSGEEEQNKVKLDDFQKQMIREHQEAVAKAEAQAGKINVIKERGRRKRIKISCDQLRDLLPKFEGRRNDMASVLEMTVKYLELVQALVPPQEQSRTLSVPESLYEKWQKPTKTEPTMSYSAQEGEKTRGRKMFPKGKKAPMKTHCSPQVAVAKKTALPGNIGVPQDLLQLSVPVIPEKQTMMPFTGSSEQNVTSPTSYLSDKWLPVLPSLFEDQSGQNLTSCKATAVQQKGFPGAIATQSANPSFTNPDPQDITEADTSLVTSALTMDPNGSNKSWISEAKPMEKSSFHIPDLDTLTAENLLGNWPEVEEPVTTDHQCAEETVTIDMNFLQQF
ncbi:uncharacterized protein LOC127582256 isoform X2 [Pristis pectinata]|uniref:uncharacterized protein LOC127582256 isoform X2 n=1 Tax=Pristis pectinata TaxID=685728 RepID=UPI00223C93F7|nr:uncharacterized protein LOC127582256 isoform X2 [Pristis pectinata]